jgi:23S rRNA (adenine1618-N6)-methyltransferase
MANSTSLLHPRNRFQSPYAFDALVKANPALKPFVIKNPKGDDTIAFSDPQAVLELNRSMLFDAYGLQSYALPQGFLCPPVPGRADYIHAVADLFAELNNGKIPKGPSVQVLDIGTGANVIYPIIGISEYQWSFVGTDINKRATEIAEAIGKANPSIAPRLSIRLQLNSLSVLKGMMKTGEVMDAVMTNPPFHASRQQAMAANARKNKGLTKTEGQPQNFSGLYDELICEGGEIGFVSRMIEESKYFSNRVLWFTALVSKKDSLRYIFRALKAADPIQHRIIELNQGNKQTRILAWSFLTATERAAWQKHWH